MLLTILKQCCEDPYARPFKIGAHNDNVWTIRGGMDSLLKKLKGEENLITNKNTAAESWLLILKVKFNNNNTKKILYQFFSKEQLDSLKNKGIDGEIL